MPAKDELDESIKRLERAHSELNRHSTPPSSSSGGGGFTQLHIENLRNQQQRQQNANTNNGRPKNSSSSSSSTTSSSSSSSSAVMHPNSNDESTKSSNQETKKTTSVIRSKGGFSIPLNASYCINPIPINCLPRHQYIYQQQQQQQQPQPNVVYYNYNHQSNHQSPSNRNSDHLFKDFDEIKAEESLLFQKKNFDLEEENSCLKEVNMRLRFAQVKNVCVNVVDAATAASAASLTTDNNNNQHGQVYAHLTRLPIHRVNIEIYNFVKDIDFF